MNTCSYQYELAIQRAERIHISKDVQERKNREQDYENYGIDVEPNMTGEEAGH